MIAAGREALDVGSAQGYPTLPIFGLVEDDMTQRETLVETLLDTLYDGFVLPGTSTTVAQDWDKGRRSEADDINGEAARLGRTVGVPTPVNDAVVQLARAVECGVLVPSPNNVARLRRILGGTEPLVARTPTPARNGQPSVEPN
jgi:2-dehydropantoate 2-reductase